MPVNKSRRPFARVGIALALLFVVVVFFRTVTSHTLAAQPAIHSGIIGYCLNARDSNIVDTQKCDNSSTQAWTADIMTIRHNGNHCLEVDGTGVGDKVVLGKCDGGAEQVWLRDKNGYINPNSELCLSLPNGKTGERLVLAPCGLLDRLGETWQASKPNGSTQDITCPDSKGERIACYAVKEWVRWQADPGNRTAFLNQYTNDYPYESWCADFISYVYREAGYPFANGESEGWDENDANKIQGMGFTLHNPSDYTPKPGDVAFFNYEGGHVELIVSGGKRPTFIYGNSSEKDPITGNGQMKANTITNDGAAGHLVYYLSPID